MCKKVLRIQEEASTDGMSDPLSAQLPSRIKNTKGQCSYDVCKIMGFFIPSPPSVLNPVNKILMSFFWANPHHYNISPYRAQMCLPGLDFATMTKSRVQKDHLGDKPIQVSPRLSIN